MRRAIFFGSLFTCLWFDALIGCIPGQHVPGHTVSAQEIGFLEEFALADDRESVLKKLVPGTESYYFFHCLHYQHTQQLEKVDSTLKPWIKRYGYTQQVNQIRNRQALLKYSDDPDATLRFLKQQLNLHFTHQREIPHAQRDLPSKLDSRLIAQDRLVKTAIARYQNTQGFTHSGLRLLAQRDLNKTQRRHLLERIRDPDFPGLVNLIGADLKEKSTARFGSLKIHQALTLEQLDELKQKFPSLANQSQYVDTVLKKLAPSEDLNWRADDESHQQYLERLWDFAKTLSPAYNSLKANILFRRLDLNRSLGVYDRELFIDYLKLPRQVPWINPVIIKELPSRGHVVNLNQSYKSQTQLIPILNEQPLIEHYLHHFLVDADDPDDFAPYFESKYLERQFATVKILNGLGDVEKWASQLTPSVYQQLMERIDLDFLPTNPGFFDPDEEVVLRLHAKNIDSLIVKVFEINTENFYRKHRREIDTNINLDGLVPNFEQTYQYDTAPALRVERKFKFPQLNERGVYVVDFIAGGKSSRALIRKGRLQVANQITAAGQRFTVFDQDGDVVQDASLWISGRRYTANEKGKILVPFTNEPGPAQAVITHQQFSSLQKFQHVSEEYQFTAAMVLDRESLNSTNRASLLIRPSLKIAGGEAVPVKLLQEPRLAIVSTSQDGTTSTKIVSDMEMSEDAETNVEFNVPPRTRALDFQLTAKIENISQGKKVDVAAVQKFEFNQIDQTDTIQDLHLAPAANGFVLEVRGKTGEARPKQPVRIQLKPVRFTHTVDVDLQSDQNGQIHLGPLGNIESLQANLASGSSKSWTLAINGLTYPQSINTLAGEPILIAAPPGLDKLSREHVALFEQRRGTIVADHFETVSLNDGLLKIEKLNPGDYLLRIRAVTNQNSGSQSDHTIKLHVTAGKKSANVLAGEHRWLENRKRNPLQIESIKTGQKKLTVQLVNSNSKTRVHVFADRYQPAFDAWRNFARVRPAEPWLYVQAIRKSVYMEGRKIGDEYQYILDRKYATKFPGNMLERPSLLLNPWSPRTTDNQSQQAQEGTVFSGAGSEEDKLARRHAGGNQAGSAQADNANLDFLGETSVVLSNLKPDKNGWLEIDLETLGSAQHIRVVALDMFSTVQKSTRLPLEPLDPRDSRLADALDPEKHFSQSKQFEVLKADDQLVVDDIISAKLQTYDDLSDVYRLLATLNPDSNLKKFEFVLTWPEQNEEQKRTLYSKHACHELNFFLREKDPEFFDSVVLKHLQHKRDQTFLDHWLLGDNLDAWLDPWKYARLNVFERILLAQRLEGHTADIVRNLHELYDLNPTPRKRFDTLYDTAIGGLLLDRSIVATNGVSSGALTLPGLAGQEMDEFGLALGVKQEQELALGKSQFAVPDESDSYRRRSNRESKSPGKQYKEKSELQSLATRPEELRKSVSANSSSESLGEDAEINADNDGNLESKYSFGFEPGDLQELERLREQTRIFYRKLPPTREWMENNYYRLLPEQQTAELVQINRFWRDYADHEGGTFLSPYFPEAHRSFTEMMFVLAVLDLPFADPESEMEYDENQLTYRAGGPTIAFHQQVEPAVVDRGNTTVLVSENFFDKNDRYRYEDGVRFDKFVSDKFYAHTLYGGQVVITNPTSTPRAIELLIQIPQGSVAVAGSQDTKTIQLDLAAFSTQTFEYSFYFPTAGDFSHYPAHVSADERVLAIADPVHFDVTDEPAQVDKTSWAYVSQNGSNDEVIEFLNTQNVQRLALGKIAFRMSDKNFFQRAVKTLRNRYAYNHVLWSYAIHHNDSPAIREFLSHAEKLVRNCGPFIDTKLLKLYPVERNWYQHREYWPLVHARAHQLGPQRKILNPEFFQQYQSLMNVMAHHPKLDHDDHLVVTYYMLLQDRVETALEHFQQVQGKSLASKIQYDYCDAYLDMYLAQPESAADKAEKWADYPVDLWRNRFNNLLSQVEEIRGGEVAVVDPEDQSQQQTKLAAKSATFDFEVETGAVKVNYQNVSEIEMNFYEMDIELLFSRSPFAQDELDGFSMIRPNLSKTVKLEAGDDGRGSQEIEIPDELANKNILVEIVAGDQAKSQPYFAHSINLQIMENYGQLQVLDEKTKRPIPKSYVKVYSRSRNGETRFHKDGYTDLRGRFDFVSQSNHELTNVEQFSLLILSDQHGAVMRQSSPPNR